MKRVSCDFWPLSTSYPLCPRESVVTSEKNHARCAWLSITLFSPRSDLDCRYQQLPAPPHSLTWSLPTRLLGKNVEFGGLLFRSIYFSWWSTASNLAFNIGLVRPHLLLQVSQWFQVRGVLEQVRGVLFLSLPVKHLPMTWSQAPSHRFLDIHVVLFNKINLKFCPTFWTWAMTWHFSGLKCQQGRPLSLPLLWLLSARIQVLLPFSLWEQPIPLGQVTSSPWWCLALLSPRWGITAWLLRTWSLEPDCLGLNGFPT